MARTLEVSEFECWLCGSQTMKLVKPASDDINLTPSSFAISDYHYGSTLSIYQCRHCGFMECPEQSDVLAYYEDLEDEEYEAGRDERLLQAGKFLDIIQKHLPAGTNASLLDIGAGSGILVEKASHRGIKAVGLEPSEWLANAGKAHDIPIYNGVLPHPEIQENFDVVTIMDVIEHVSNPKQLVKEATKRLSPNGLLVVSTPDRRSLAAKFLGWRWWHYRIAHIGYFSRKNLVQLLESEGLKVEAVRRPGWYFKAGYLMERLLWYVPFKVNMKLPKFLKDLVIPLNLFDSLLIVARKK